MPKVRIWTISRPLGATSWTAKCNGAFAYFAKAYLSHGTSHIELTKAAGSIACLSQRCRAEKIEDMQEQMESITEQEVHAWSCREVCLLPLCSLRR